MESRTARGCPCLKVGTRPTERSTASLSRTLSLEWNALSFGGKSASPPSAVTAAFHPSPPSDPRLRTLPLDGRAWILAQSAFYLSFGWIQLLACSGCRGAVGPASSVSRWVPNTVPTHVHEWSAQALTLNAEDPPPSTQVPVGKPRSPSIKEISYISRFPNLQPKTLR